MTITATTVRRKSRLAEWWSDGELITIVFGLVATLAAGLFGILNAGRTDAIQHGLAVDGVVGRAVTVTSTEPATRQFLEPPATVLHLSDGTAVTLFFPRADSPFVPKPGASVRLWCETSPRTDVGVLCYLAADGAETR